MNAQLNPSVGSADEKSGLINECSPQTRVSRLDAGRCSVAGGQHFDGHRRLRDGRALIALLMVVALTAVLAVGFIFAQSPPMPALPPPPELRPVKILWDPQPASEYYHAVDTNGNFVGITYRVYNASNVTGPWTVVATTTNLSATVSNLTARTQFFYVTASNFFWRARPAESCRSPRTRCRCRDW